MQSLFGQSGPRDPIERALADAPLTTSAGPWLHMTTTVVGGLNAIGFDRHCEDMLVTSINGQSVISGQTGEIIYRNRDNDGLDTAALKGTRLDHPAEERIDMAGLFGGGLRTMTNDGWTIEAIGAAPTNCVLKPPQAHTSNGRPYAAKDTTVHLIARESEDIRAFGFSWTGYTLVIATASDLTIWARPAPLTL